MQAFVFLCMILLQTSTSEVVVTDDLYEGYFGKMFQKMRDDMGTKWRRPVQPNNLDLLFNDKIEIKDSCIEERKFKTAEKMTGNEMTFKEIAKVCCHVLFLWMVCL